MHSVSIKVLGLSIDGKGWAGVIAVPVVLLIICLAGMTLGNGAAWLARLSTQSNAITENAPAATGVKD
ncbi:hypothetical protein [Brevundimonas sp. TSRC1-1]|uniref:hypothetical protein n=1 Tax=Brevundimonas sp. TSRC1-1 TaxID=2804562 RepID=UPI003CF16D27